MLNREDHLGYFGMSKLNWNISSLWQKVSIDSWFTKFGQNSSLICRFGGHHDDDIDWDPRSRRCEMRMSSRSGPHEGLNIKSTNRWIIISLILKSKNVINLWDFVNTKGHNAQNMISTLAVTGSDTHKIRSIKKIATSLKTSEWI